MRICCTVIVSRDTEPALALEKGFLRANLRVKIIAPDSSPIQADNLAGLILLSPLTPQQAFLSAQTYGAQLCRSSANARPFFCSVSFLDGAFGFKRADIDDPDQGALAGLVKTARQEWPGVRCLSLDLDPRWIEYDKVADAIICELFSKNPESAVEIGLSSKGRHGLKLVSKPFETEQTIQLCSQDVAVVSGGARGVTAFAAKALAQKTGCQLALLGRSANPQAEPHWLAGLTDAAEIKQAIFAYEMKDSEATPSALEKAYRHWMANREVRNCLEDLDAAGIANRYYSVDVRSQEAVNQVLAEIREQMGPVRCLIHGAGILEDRLILDKTTTQFEEVYGTKVLGLKSLDRATRNDPLRYITLFSSISGRLGNVGQADYAMANEVLNKTALRLSRLHPDCKVVAINWGPWDGGMVTAGLKRHFLDRGVCLIPLQQGAQAMLAEMASPKDCPIEVVIGGMPENARLKGIAPMNEEKPIAELYDGALHLAAKRRIDLDGYPVLQSHYLDGRPVVPLALIAEWLAHGALHSNPGLRLHGIDHLRLYKGISLEDSYKNIALMAGIPKRRGSLFEVDVEIHDVDGDQRPFVHSRATAVLTDNLPAAPQFEENGHFKASLPSRSLNDYYREVLFHGDALKGLKKIIRICDHGMTAQIDAAPAPSMWINDPWRTQWITDPLVLDGAFQMAIIWCHEQLNLFCLPNYLGTYRQYCDRYPAQGVTAVLEVLETTRHKLMGTFTFLSPSGTVLADLKGFEAIMDRNLYKAFGVKAA